MREFLTAVLFLAAFSSARAADPLTVQTGDGPLRGTTLADGKVNAFLGIPYAAPPIGPLRWKPPAPPAKWTEPRDASQFGHHCPQFESFPDQVFPDAGESEDCLTLNVYAPARARKLPVMVWIHGGGFAGGAGSEPRSGGESLAQQGVLVVTLNYRLGALGFLALPGLIAEADTAGNYGLRDMIAALGWVKGNIAAFGGDPDNVTLFGESAGSIAVADLMTAPWARGLFHKAIGESGGIIEAEPLDRNAKTSAALTSQPGAETLAKLRAMPVKDLIAAVKAAGIHASSPVIDGKVLPEPILRAFKTGHQMQIPLLAGWNRDEGWLSHDIVDAVSWRRWLHKTFHAEATQIAALYPGRTDAEALRSATDFAGDRFIAFGTWLWLEDHRKTGHAPVYRYEFDLVPPKSRFHGETAFHSGEIEYVFGTLDTRPDSIWRQKDRDLSAQMQLYWANFARTSNPNSAGLPTWPLYETGDPILHLGAAVTARPDDNRPRQDYWLAHHAAP